MTVPVLQVEGLTVALPRGGDRREAVSGVSFEIPQGQLVCLVGESGSGKSIIAHTVMGLTPRNIRATAGEVRVNGEALLHAAPRRLRQLRGDTMSMIFQEPMTALNPVMTCGSQIDELLVQHTHMSAPERWTRILEILAHVRLADPERLFHSYPHQLSGGQRQRIMIAMALILAPALLIADEPTTALDVTTQAEILRLIRELQAESNTAVLFITHDFGVVAEVADSVVVLQRGRLVESGSARDVLTHPQHPYTRALLKAVPSLTPRKPTPERTGAMHLQTRQLTKVFESGGWFRRRPALKAVDAIDLDVRKGDTVGIVGESGSGKSTLARLLARLIEATSGEIDVDARAITGLRGSAAHQFRRKVQMVFQDPYRSLNPRRTVGAAISEGPLNFGATRSDAWQRAAELMDLVKLSPRSLHRYPHEFSGGQRQRICIARALAVDPEILIADEAVSALDVSIQAQILSLLDDVQQRLNLTLVFITHDLRVAAQICNRVVVLQSGRVVEHGPLADVFQNPRHEYTRALLQAAPGRGFAFGGGRRQSEGLNNELGTHLQHDTTGLYSRVGHRGSGEHLGFGPVSFPAHGAEDGEGFGSPGPVPEKMTMPARFRGPSRNWRASHNLCGAAPTAPNREHLGEMGCTRPHAFERTERTHWEFCVRQVGWVSGTISATGSFVRHNRTRDWRSVLRSTRARTSPGR